MPRARLLLLVAAVAAVSSRCAESVQSVRGVRFVDRTSAAWQSQQVQEPCIVPNPRDPTRLVMLYSGVPAADRKRCDIGKAWALRSDPLKWHEDKANPVFSPSRDGWDSGSIRLDAVVHVPEEDSYYIYYSGTRRTIQDRIGLAICPVGDDGYSGITPEAIRRFGDRPVLAPDPAAPFHEEMASQAAVWRERNPTDGGWDWYLYYSYRGKDGVLPGIRLATSRDGKTWTRRFNAADPRGMGQIFESVPGAYYEWHQVFKVGGTYVLSIEVGPEKGQRWRPVLAVSGRPDTGWRQLDVDAALQTKWTGLYRDDTMYHVATPAFYGIDGRWYLYVQACPLPANRNYIDGSWDMWAIACDRRIPTLPGLADLFIPGSTVAAGR